MVLQLTPPKYQLRLILAVSLLLATAWSSPSSGAPRSNWYPVSVDVWDPPFNSERRRETKSYSPLQQAAKPWHFCVLIPHLKDSYWLAVNYGLVAQARDLGIDISVFEAGGYERLDVQRRQFDQCLQQREKPFDGIIVGAIAADGLDEQIAQARSQNIPVLDLINGIDSPDITARSAVDFYDLGFLAGEYLRRLETVETKELGVAWFPGPDGAGWVAAGDAGFRAALADSHVRILVTSNGDTGKATQAELIEAALEELPDKSIDYVVGTTVSAEAAVAILRSSGLEEQIKVLAYYFGPGVNRGIRRGSILAAPSDSTVIQARIAIDTMVRIMEGQPYFTHVGPQIQLVDQNSIDTWDASTALAPRGFRPVFRVGN
jgi:protein TorT